MTNADRVAVLERIVKYAREDRAVTPRSTRLARALDELDALPATLPDVVWVLRSEVRDFFTETCAVLRSRKAAVELASGFGADTSKDPGDDANEVEFKGPGGDCVYTITRREVES